MNDFPPEVVEKLRKLNILEAAIADLTDEWISIPKMQTHTVKAFTCYFEELVREQKGERDIEELRHTLDAMVEFFEKLRTYE